MSSPPSKQPKPQLPGDDRNVAPATTASAQSWEERVQILWFENKNGILVGCVVVLAALVGYQLVEMLLEKRQLSISAAYGTAITSPEKLRAFAQEHPDHKLAGLAWLTVADDAFKGGRYSDAIGSYEKAAPLVAGSPLAGRVAVGLAVSRALTGDKTKAEASLKLIAADEKELRSVRTEARYQLAVLAVEDGKTDDARKLIDEILQTDMSGAWAQRAMSLRIGLPEPAQAQPEAATVPAAAAPEIKLTLPRKP